MGVWPLSWRSRGGEAVVPFGVPVVAAEAPALLEVAHLTVADLDALGVLAGVESGGDGQAGTGAGAADQADDDFVAGQRPAAPVHRDVGEQPVLDLVPLGGAGREVADGDLQPGLGGQRRKLGLPQPDRKST